MVRNQDDDPQEDPFSDGMEVENEADWFFDLPDGAWERQEEKSRSLRDRLLNHAGANRDPLPSTQDEPEAVTEPIEPKADEKSEPKAERRRCGFGRDRNESDAEEPKSAESDGSSWESVPPHLGGEEDSVETFDAEEHEDADGLGTRPHLEFVDNSPREDLPDSVTDLADYRIRDAEPTDEGAEAAATSKWDEALAASDSSGDIINGVREWAERGNTPQHESTASDSVGSLGAERAADVAPEDEAGPDDESDHTRKEPDDDWVVDLLEADEQIPVPVEQKTGLFSKLFGRGKQPDFDEDESLERAETELDWTIEDPENSPTAALDEGNIVSEQDPWAEFLSDAEEGPGSNELHPEPVAPGEPLPETETDAVVADVVAFAEVSDSSGNKNSEDFNVEAPDLQADDHDDALPETHDSASTDDDFQPTWTDFRTDAPADVDAEEDALTSEASTEENLGESQPEDPDIAPWETTASTDTPTDDDFQSKCADFRTDESAENQDVGDHDEERAFSTESFTDETATEPSAFAAGDGWDDVFAALGDELERDGIDEQPGVILGRTGVTNRQSRVEDESEISPVIGDASEDDHQIEAEEVHEESGWQLAAEPTASAADDDDVVLRAFNAHDAAVDDEPSVQPEFEDEPRESIRSNKIFDEDTEELVHEPMDASNEHGRPVGQPAWAPQRAVDVDDVMDVTNYGYEGSHSSEEDDPPEPPWAQDDEEGAAGGDSGHRRAKTIVRELVETGLLALLVFLAVRTSFQNFKVEGQSMMPTLEDGQYIIVNKLAYSEVDMDKLNDFVPFVSAEEGEEQYVFSGPERGTIVVFHSPRNTSEDLIKRIIGLPGETIEIIDGQTYINGFRLDEPYTNGDWSRSKYYARVLIGPDEYFVMGDNRNNSQDSRVSSMGLIHRDLIIGKAIVAYWPKSQVGFAPNGGAVLTDEPVPASSAKAPQ